jgi:excisionase family DNA binding protein
MPIGVVGFEGGDHVHQNPFRRVTFSNHKTTKLKTNNSGANGRRIPLVALIGPTKDTDSNGEAMADNTTPYEATGWLKVRQAAQKAKTGEKTIYRELRAGRLRAARVGGRRDYRILDRWVDEWLESQAMPVEVSGRRR